MTTNDNNTNKTGKTPTKNTTTGAIEELKGNIFALNSGHHGNQFAKTTTAIADYCGREYGKPMSLLIKGIDAAPSEPKRPTVKKSEADSWDVLLYEKKVDLWLKETRKYEDNKSKVFIVVMGHNLLNRNN